MMEKPVTDLPEPDSPTSPRNLAATQAQVDPVHRPHDPGPGGELGVQPLDAQQFAAAGPQRCSLGLRMSRSSSPTRLMATTVIRSATPGNTLIHG